MAHSIVMPALEMAQETGKLLSWRKKEGDNITKGEPLLDIETDKAVVEIEAPADGILAGLKAHEGDVIPVGQTIGWIVAPGERPPVEEASAASGRRMDSKPAPATAASTPAAPAAAVAPAAGIRISPKARRLAREHGVDPALLRGSGAEGEISAEDVLAFVNTGKLQGSAAAVPAAAKTAQAEARATESGQAKAYPTETAEARPGKQAKAYPAETSSPQGLSQVARLMAERTTQSWTTVPHFFVTREMDASALLAAREKFGPEVEKERGVRLSHTDLLIAAVSRALAKHPLLNASWTGNEIRLHPEINMGIAMAVEGGVVAAVIPSAGTKRLGEIAALRQELTERARAGKLRPADISGGTFTISNLGMYKVDSFTAIIVPPQAAILAVGQIADRVVPVDGQPGIRPILSVTLSCDHRVADGARGALFLNDLSEVLLDLQNQLG